MNGCRYMNDASFCIAKMGLIFRVIGWHFFGVMHLNAYCRFISVTAQVFLGIDKRIFTVN